jgi:hypothetical protein
MKLFIRQEEKRFSDEPADTHFVYVATMKQVHGMEISIVILQPTYCRCFPKQVVSS